MELRHLRYFIAAAEVGKLTEAADWRLHTSQPSLSRQIRDLEHQVGVELLGRRLDYPPALVMAFSACMARLVTRSAAEGRSVMRSTASPAHTGTEGIASRATSFR